MAGPLRREQPSQDWLGGGPETPSEADTHLQLRDSRPSLAKTKDRFTLAQARAAAGVHPDSEAGAGATLGAVEGLSSALEKQATSAQPRENALPPLTLRALRCMQDRISAAPVTKVSTSCHKSTPASHPERPV